MHVRLKRNRYNLNYKMLKNTHTLIGNTPLVKLLHMPKPDSAEIWVKWEGANPTGSMKDRMALGMIEAAEREW
jgi:cysteine synthase